MEKEKLLYKRNRHSCFELKYHLVVVTKYKNPVLKGALLNRLYEISHSVMEENWDCHIIEMKAEPDHIHILFEAKPQTKLSALVNSYKTVTSRLIRKEFPNELKPFFWENLFWSRSYFIGTVSDRIEDAVRQYINNQGG